MAGTAMWQQQGAMAYDGKRVQKTMNRRTVDFNSSMVRYLQDRVWQRDHRDQPAVQPHHAYFEEMFPPHHFRSNPTSAVTTKFVRSATNKFRSPIFAVQWMPDGRRIITGASSGEFTLWNGLTFNFETILQAHEVAIRSIMWSHNDLFMVSCDNAGFVKYWQSNMNAIKMFQAHKDPIRDSSFSPNDSKLITCSDDSTIRVWDFVHCHEEQVLRGHGADVKSCDWHPTKGLVVSGSRDSQQNVKLWNPKTGEDLCTLHGHKSTVTCTKFNRNGNWLLTASRDHLLKLWDIRMMKEITTFRGHKKEIHSVGWHPHYEDMFASGGADGSVLFWMTNNDREIGSIESAHESPVWTMTWHPFGHMLVTGANDHSTKFWTRTPPGDTMQDKYNLGGMGAAQPGLQAAEEDDQDDLEAEFIPGMGEIVKGVSIPSDLITSHKTAAPSLKPVTRKETSNWRSALGSNTQRRGGNQPHRTGSKNAGPVSGSNQEQLSAQTGSYLSRPAGQTAAGKDMIDPLSVPPQLGILQLLKQKQDQLLMQQHDDQQPVPPRPVGNQPSNHPPGPSSSAPPYASSTADHSVSQPPPPGDRTAMPPSDGPTPFLRNVTSMAAPSHFGPRQFSAPPAEKRPWPAGDKHAPDGPPAQIPRSVGDPSNSSSSAFPTSGGDFGPRAPQVSSPMDGPPGGAFQRPPFQGPPDLRPPFSGPNADGPPPGPPGPRQGPHPPDMPPPMMMSHGPDGNPGQQPPRMHDGPPPIFDGGGPPPGPPHPDWRGGPPRGMPPVQDGHPPPGMMHPPPDGPGGVPGSNGPPPPGWFPPNGAPRGGHRKRGGGGGKRMRRGRGGGPSSTFS